MTVRIANFSDIPAMVGIMERAQQRSRYADVTTFDEVEAKQLLVRSIQRHGHQNYMGSMVLVSETKDEIRGFIVGILDQVYPAVKELRVTDLLILFEDGADPRDFPKMVLELVEWGRNNLKVVDIFLGVTDAIVDWERVSPIYEKIGLVQCGGLFRMTFDRSMQQKAEGF